MLNSWSIKHNKYYNFQFDFHTRPIYELRLKRGAQTKKLLLQNANKRLYTVANFKVVNADAYIVKYRLVIVKLDIIKTNKNA